MKILCITGLPLSAPTIESRLIPLISNLGEHSFELVVPKSSGIWKEKEYRQKLPDHVAVTECPSKFLYPFYSVKRNLFRDFDAVYVSKLSRLSSLPGYILSKIKRKPLIVDCDDYDWSSGPISNKIIGNFVMKHNDHLITASRELNKRFGGTYIPNTTDLKKFDPGKYRIDGIRKRYGIKPDEKIIIWPGILHSTVDVKFLAETGNRLKDSYLLIVGTGDKFKELENAVKSNRVILTGMIAKDEMPCYYAAADAGILTFPKTDYHMCKCPIKLFEYMAMELPVFTTPVGEPKYMVEKVKCGFICENSQDFVEKTENTPKSELVKLGKKGRKYLEENQNWGVLSKKLSKIFSISK